MRDQEMPDHGLEGLGVRRDCGRVYDRDDDAGVGDLCSVAAVAADHSADFGADLARVLQSAHEIGADIFLRVATADGKNKHQIVVVQPRTAKPVGVASVPAIIVDPGGEFGNVVGGSVRFDLRYFAEVTYRVGSVARAAADPQEEKPAGTFAKLGEQDGRAFDGILIEKAQNVCGFLNVLRYVTHGLCLLEAS